jgi:hypothetical protein
MYQIQRFSIPACLTFIIIGLLVPYPIWQTAHPVICALMIILIGIIFGGVWPRMVK